MQQEYYIVFKQNILKYIRYLLTILNRFDNFSIAQCLFQNFYLMYWRYQ